MTIRFVENTNIRSRPDDLSDDALIGQVYAGAFAEVEETPYLGADIEDNDHWWRDTNGWFYWSGRTEVLAPVAEPPASPVQVRSALFQADPLADLDELAHNVAPGNIPEGETRPLVAPAAPPTRREAPLPVPAILPAQPAALAELKTENQAVGGSLAFDPSRAQVGWAVRGLDLPDQWWAKGLTGKGVRVALLSTGVATAAGDLQGAIGAEFQAHTSGPLDDTDGLGTQAAVVAVGRGKLCAGVAPEATLLVGKIGELDHLITPEALLAGIDWAISQQADVVAMLVDFAEIDDATQQLLQQKISAAPPNTLFVAPVGNSTERSPQRRFPAALDGVLSVGAHDSLGTRSFFSARSYRLDVLAPGEGVPTVGLGGNSAALSRPTTSVAAAMVAGVLALLRQREPAATPAVLFEQLRKAAESPKPHVAAGEDVEYGYGRLVLPL